MRRWIKWWWRGVLLVYGAAAFFGTPLPRDWNSTLNWLTDADLWMINHAAYPSFFAIFIGLTLGTVVIPEGMRIARNTLGLDVVLRPHMSIDRAVDYMVNDSRAKLRQPAPPRIVEIGAGQQQRIIEMGVQHADALRKLNEEAIAGHVQIWGLRQTPNGFESVRRPIPIDYWTTFYLHPLMCFHNTNVHGQTMRIAGTPMVVEETLYSGLMLNRSQVGRIWPKKWIWTRFIEWLRRTPRIRYSSVD